MYGCESWIIKKAEHWRIDAFELWYWRRLLSVPFTLRNSNQSTLKEINPEYSLEGLMLKLQPFGHLMRRADSLERPDAGKGWGQEKGATEDEMVGWHDRLNGQEFEQILGDSHRQGSLACCGSWGCKESDTTERLNNRGWYGYTAKHNTPFRKVSATREAQKYQRKMEVSKTPASTGRWMGWTLWDSSHLEVTRMPR